MAHTRFDEPTLRKPLRLWPGVVIVALIWLLRFVVPRVVPETLLIGLMAEFVGALALIVWWLGFSRAPWLDRLGGVLVIVVAVALTPRILHPSVATGGMGLIFVVYVIPFLCLTFVLWAAASRRLGAGPRRATMVATILLTCGAWALVRTGGITGDGESDLHWRWTETPEERLLARGEGSLQALAAPPAARDEPALPPAPAPAPAPAPEGPVPAAEPAVERTAAEWPGFRGPHRDGIAVSAVPIETDWSRSPPVELWRRPVGPGWSSFAVRGDLLYTQEQRGDEEVVTCYAATTGEPVWRHADTTRFWESNAGAGPRSTPTLADGRVYTFGATGILNALEAADGSVVWSRDVASETGVNTPHWGFSGSPIVLEELVIAAASGTLVGYDRTSGERRWAGPVGRVSYSSPHLVTIDGAAQVLLLNDAGLASFAPADGTLLWEHAWEGAPIVQPAQHADGDLLLSVSESSGIRRLAVARGPEGWTVEERWTSPGLKPYFNDFVVHDGHAYGFDGGILSCIDLESGARAWKGGRYGHGQMILLPGQDVMLVLSERGELALVAATPDRFAELARFPAIEGKTWNHPVLAGDVLYVRNDEEMAAFRLSLAGG